MLAEPIHIKAVAVDQVVAVPARQAGAKVVIINAEPTAMDDIAHALFREPIGRVLPQLCGPSATH